MADNIKTYEMVYCPACNKLVPQYREACCWCGADIQELDKYYTKHQSGYSGLKKQTFRITDVPQYVQDTDYHSGEINYSNFNQYLIFLIPACLFFALTQGGIFVIAGIIIFAIFGFSKQKEHDYYYISGEDNNKRGLIEQAMEQDAKDGDINDKIVLISRKKRKLAEILIPFNKRIHCWNQTFARYCNDWIIKFDYYDIPSVEDLGLLERDPDTDIEMFFKPNQDKPCPFTMKDLERLEKDRIIAEKIKARVTKDEWEIITHGLPSCHNSQYMLYTKVELIGFGLFDTTYDAFGSNRVTRRTFNDLEKLYDIEWGDEIL